MWAVAHLKDITEFEVAVAHLTEISKFDVICCSLKLNQRKSHKFNILYDFNCISSFCSHFVELNLISMIFLQMS